MQNQRQRLAALDSGVKTAELDRFTPLLAVIRDELGDDWPLYEECIQGLLDAAANHQDTTAWFEQMKQLVLGIEKAHISHEGIIFLLQEMGVRVPKLQNWSEGQGNSRKFLSPALPPPQPRLETTPSSKTSMGPSRLPTRPTMNPPPALLQPPPGTPVVSARPVPRAPTPRPRQQQSQSQVQQQPQPRSQLPQQPPHQHQPRVLRDGVLPFDYSASVLPQLTFPKNLRAYHYPPDRVTMTADYVSPPATPLRKASKDPVFYQDPALKAHVAEVFGHEVQWEGSGGGNVQQRSQRLPYETAGDDLAAWRKTTGADADVGNDEVKARGAATGTWPPWDFRFDSEL